MAAGVLSCAAAAQPITPPVSNTHANRPTLGQAFNAAWQLSLEASEASGRQRQALAEQSAANAWLAAPPSFEVVQREGRRPGDSRETELGITMPLWRPGQRAVASQAAQAELDWAAADGLAARWRLAGLVRESAAALQAGESELRLTGLQRQLLQQIADDVARRVGAGDLAPADALAANADLAEAEALDTEAQQRLQVQRSLWKQLTGLAVAPETANGSQPPSTPLPGEHPELLLARQALERARQRAALVQFSRGSAPEVGLSLRQDRPGQGGGVQQSVALGLRIPFGTETHFQPRLAAALAEQDLAQTMEQRTQARLRTELELAQSELISVTEQARLADRRAALLRDRATLINKSFDAGETPLPELLRALNAASQAEAAASRKHAALRLAHARLQQVSGILP